MHQYECGLCDAVVEYEANDRHPADWVEAGLCDQCYHQLAALATPLPLLPGEERFMDQRAGNYRFSLN